MLETHFYKVSRDYKYLVNIKPKIYTNKHRNWIKQNTAIVSAMLAADMRLQTFSRANDFCFTVLMKLLAPLDNTAVTELLLTEPDTSHITKVDPCLKHRFKLGFTVYSTSEITQQLTDVMKSFSTIWKDHGLSVDLSKQNWMIINLKEDVEL